MGKFTDVRYFGRKGEPLTLEDFAQKFEDVEYRRVAFDAIEATSRHPPTVLSTVWLGINHSWNPDGFPPVIFETMRFIDAAARQTSGGVDVDFPDPEAPEDFINQARYSTEEQATLGHQRIIQLIREQEKH